MPTLQEVVQTHLELSGKSIRALAKEAKITYPTLLGVVNRGSVPRKSEHRESLREVLEIDDEDEWQEILMASTTNGMAITPGQTQTLQQLISQKMYARGMTEQQLAEQAEVAYSTVMGITRKGSIPREDSLNSVVDVLGLEPEEVRAAIGASRAMRRSGGTDVIEKEPKEVIGLAQVVGKHIRTRGQSMGSFAEDLGVGYFLLSRFLETGEPPKDKNVLKALRKMLDLSKEDFDDAVAKGKEEPEPAELGPQDELLGEDANALQLAMVNYMREHDLTLKALAKRADLSQVTVSRLVKQGQAPTRATTHIKLQELLGLSPNRYQALVGTGQDETGALTVQAADADEEETDGYAADDSYEPQGIAEAEQKATESGPQESIAALSGSSGVPTKDELIALVKKLGPKQREALKTFLAAMV